MLRRNKTLLTLMLTALALTLSAPAWAQGKIAVIDVDEVLKQSEQGKAMQAMMAQAQAEEKAKLEGLQNEILSLKKQIEDGRLSLAQDRLESLQEEYERKVVDFQRGEKDANRELQRKGEKLLAEVEKQIMPVIARIGKEQGFLVILNKYQSGLLFADESVDITAQVVAAMNKPAAGG
jgi:outer membrane protein